MVGISPSFSVVDKIGCYINRISLLWTILAVISTGFVCHGEYWLVNPPVLSVVNNIGCLSWTVMVGYLLVLSVVDKIGWYINRFCLS